MGACFSHGVELFAPTPHELAPGRVFLGKVGQAVASRQERKEEVELGSQAGAETLDLGLGEPCSAWFWFLIPQHSTPCHPAATTYPHSLVANSLGLRAKLKPWPGPFLAG